MALQIENYAVVGDTETVAVVGNNGSIDWLCLPRFDSAACFAALLGDESNGRWQIAPVDEVARVERQYRPGTLILETTFETAQGAVRVIDFMPPRDENPDVIRIVEGVRGRVSMRMDLNPRFDYGRRLPIYRRVPGGVFAMAGPDALVLGTSIQVEVSNGSVTSEFPISEGQRILFRLTWFPSHLSAPAQPDAFAELSRTEQWWKTWSDRCTYQGSNRETVLRSLITLKALTYAPTGAIVAAATTSLPEEIGGVRNWDYRFCWLRDSAFTISALAKFGYTDEAVALGGWLRRAVAGDPTQIQIMYGINAEQRLTEFELPWLSGYEGSGPVRVGNAASDQFQLDVYGEVISAAYRAALAGVRPRDDATKSPGLNLEAIIGAVERHWREPDEGIWEVRGERQHFTYSKFAAWYAVDRGLKLAEMIGRDVPVARWEQLRSEIHDDICQHGYNAERGSFVQYYGANVLDASLLLIPGSGFLPADDSRIIGTVNAIAQELTNGPFVSRYSTDEGVDGLAGHEGAFLICSFWLVDALAHIGRTEDAQRNLDALMALQNDVGLLSEEYDPVGKRLLGNFPQAFSHIGLLSSILAVQDGHLIHAGQ